MNPGNQRNVLAIDPGSSKCGLALARREPDGQVQLIWRAISSIEELAENVSSALQLFPVDLFVVGSGTSSKKIVEILKENFPHKGVLLVDEKGTSQQAREKYWEFNKRRGWRLLIPASMQVPPVPIDDFSAFILAERILKVDV
jgi:RNase H-fold protein (predicted Holliday junction resolvase)